MAGSKKLFIYEDDTTKKYLVSIDESNALAVEFPAAANSDLGLPVLPRYLRMRYVNCTSATGVRRRIYIPTVANPFWQGTQRTMNLSVYSTGLSASAQQFTTSSRIGEKERYLATADTGLTDNPGEGQTPAIAPAT